jgi:hypothetical protein
MTDVAGTYPFGRAEVYPRTAHIAGDTVNQRDVARAQRATAFAVKHVALRVDPSQMREVHRELAQRLTREAGLQVSFVNGRAAVPVPSWVALLLQFERLAFRLSGRKLGDGIEFDQALFPEHAPNEAPDLVFDFCGEETDPGERNIGILFDGVAGDAVLISALLAGRMPVIELEAAGSRQVLARGVPCADNAGSITDALECVLARVVTLALAVARGGTTLSSARAPAPRSARLRDMAAFEVKTASHAAIRRLYKLCCYAPHRRTCWRFLDGPDLWQTKSVAGTTWNVIPDSGFRFYADPFPFVHEGRTWVFVEDLDHRTNKACISVLPFDERGPTGPAQPVLEEPWHLSYPCVFRHEGQVWMVPESSANRSVVLYRADPFPHRWVPEAVLLSDIEASDATIVRHGGCFWMFAATRDGFGSWSDTLSIFSASALQGPWTPHAANPVLVDQASARPAGAMMVRDGKLWRPVQDCTSGYGTGIGLAEVTQLNHERFEQKVDAVLRADPSWPGRRFHTLNRAGRLECIDGSAHSPRIRSLARLF